MMKKFYGKVRRAVGFTTAEVLIVVAIIAVLLTLAMPNVLAYFRGLRLTELDDDARTIFLAAQNRLTALVNSGEADKLKGKQVDVFPGGEDGSATPVGLYMLSSDESDAMSLLIPAGSIESSLTSGHYIVYYFPNSGAVYSVWFCDKDGFSTEFTDKDKRLQQSVLVGYYGDSEGNVIDRAKVGQLPIPKVTLTNAEELRLDIEMPIESGSEVKPENVTLEVTITGASGGAVKTLLKANFGAGDPAHKVTIVLDTLKDGYTMPTDGAVSLNGMENFGGQFKNIVSGTLINPGEDITVTVKVSYTPDEGGKDFTDQTVSVKGNSLFASVSKDATGAGTANIAYGRHLQNLDAAASGVANTITAANQIRDIDFADNKSEKDIESWEKTYPGKNFEPISNDNITSYDGNKLKIRHMTANVSGDYSGLFKEIKGFDGENKAAFTDIVLVDCKAGGDGVANVGTLAGTAENTIFSGCEVYVEDRQDDKTVSTDPLLTGTTVGGLVGTVNGGCEFEYSFASTVESGKTVGGLVGEAATGDANTITSCYAAGYLKYLGSERGGGAAESGYIAGLVGNSTVETTIKNCYTAGVITGDLLHDNSGGSSGKSATVAGTANGTGASVPDGSTVYAAVIYSNTGTHSGDIPVTATVAHPLGNCFYVNQSGVTFNKSEAVKKTASGMMMDTTSFTEANWYKSDGSSSNPGYTVFPYKQTDKSKTLTSPYPYPELKDTREGKSEPILHHGDWPRFYNAGYFYWELEADAYHFYLVEWESEDGENWHNIGGDTKDKATLIDDLCYEYHEIDAAAENLGVPNIDDFGYGYFTSGFDTGDMPSFTNPGVAVYSENNVLSSYLESLVGTSVTATAYSYRNYASTATTATWTAGNGIPSMTFCPDFAAAIALNGGAVDKDGDNIVYFPTDVNSLGSDKNHSYNVRALQQFDNLDKNSGSNYFNQGKFIKQSHDINGGTLTTLGSASPEIVFKGTYDGDGYRFLELNIVGYDDHGGLFAALGGATVQNVIMYSPSGDAEVNVNYQPGGFEKSVNVGGIAGEGYGNGNRIENCIVAGYKIKVSGSYGTNINDSSTPAHYIGGIVGWYIGTVTNCEAVVSISSVGPTNSVNEKYCNCFAGGIVGSGNSLTIRNCYAGGIINKATSGANTVSQFAGGIVGIFDHKATNKTIEGCYSYMMFDFDGETKNRNSHYQNGNTDIWFYYSQSTVQAIGAGSVTTTPSNGTTYQGNGTYANNYFWSSVLKGSYADNGAASVNYEGLREFATWTPTYFSRLRGAEYVNGRENTDFHFGAVVQVNASYNKETGNRTTAYVHYGWYPTSDADTTYPTP